MSFRRWSSPRLSYARGPRWARCLCPVWRVSWCGRLRRRAMSFSPSYVSCECFRHREYGSRSHGAACSRRSPQRGPGPTGVYLKQVCGPFHSNQSRAAHWSCAGSLSYCIVDFRSTSPHIKHTWHRNSRCGDPRNQSSSSCWTSLRQTSQQYHRCDEPASRVLSNATTPCYFGTDGANCVWAKRRGRGCSGARSSGRFGAGRGRRSCSC